MLIHLIDDDPKLNRALARSLEAHGWRVRTFHSATEFLDVIDPLEGGCILLDINMPVMSGLDALAQIANRLPCSPVVMISGTAEVDHAVRAFRGGALHLIRKPFRHEELLAALAEAAAEAEHRQAAELKNQTAVNIRLSQREREVLAAVARGLQSKQIAWELGISARTVHLHRSNAMAKLGVRNSSQAIAKARSLNLLKDEFPVAA